MSASRSSSAHPGRASAVTPPLSQRLREGTREAHERVEHGASFNRLVVVRIPETAADAGPAERERRARALRDHREVYRRFLVAAHGFEAAVERCIAASPALPEALRRGYEPEPHTPTALIRDDLSRVFGPAAVAEVGVMEGLPDAPDLPELVGVEYVRRGSRAGGAVIAAVVERNLGFTRTDGASFLGPYGKRTRSIITAYKDWVDGLGLSEAEAHRAVTAAVETFHAVERWHLRLEQRFARA